MLVRDGARVDTRALRLRGLEILGRSVSPLPSLLLRAPFALRYQRAVMHFITLEFESKSISKLYGSSCRQ